ncbi:MAG: LamG-like jellyroll fold domain-containing protein [Gaiellales bacterium]
MSGWGKVGASMVLGLLVCTLFALPAQAAPTVVANWHMDETSGSTMHDAAGGHDGTLHGGVSLGVAGFSGTAYTFNGTNSYVTVPSSPDLNPGTADMSFTVHVKLSSPPPTGKNKDYDILRKGISSTKGGMYKLEIAHDGRATCRFLGSVADVRIHTGPNVADGKWHTITCGRAGSAISLTVDGKTFSHAGATGTIGSTDGLAIGAKPGSDYYKGALDEVSITVG